MDIDNKFMTYQYFQHYVLDTIDETILSGLQAMAIQRGRDILFEIIIHLCYFLFLMLASDHTFSYDSEWI